MLQKWKSKVPCWNSQEAAVGVVTEHEGYMMERRQTEDVTVKSVPLGENNKFKDFDMEKLMAFWMTHSKRCQNSFDFYE